MTLLMSEEKMELLGLSEEARELLRTQNAEISKQATELAETRKASRKASIDKRLADLGEEGFKAFPAFLKEVEATLLSDDGEIALKLQLSSDSGYTTTVPETATAIVDRLLKALPRKEGKVDFGEVGDLTASPLPGRPDLTPPDPAEKDKPKSGQDLLDEWYKADPSLKGELALSSDNGKGK